jgi:hypothetical protein
MHRLDTYEHKRCSSDMFWDKCTIFREHSMSCLKPIASDKPLFTKFHEEEGGIHGRPWQATDVPQPNWLIVPYKAP